MIVKCSHCKELLNESEFNNHKCNLPNLSDVQNIEVVYFHDVSHGNRKLMTGLGLDGVLYRFEVVPRKAIPYILSLSDEKKHVSDFRQEGNRTLTSNAYI